MKNAIPRSAVVVTLGLLLSSCVDGNLRSNQENGGRVDMQEAAIRADGIMDAALGEIDPEVQWAHGPTTSGSCDVTRRRTVMTIVSGERRGSFLGMVDRFWKASGYKMKGVNNNADSPAIYAQTEDGFGVSLIFGGEGQAFFEVDSPCVEKSKVAESTTPPNGPAYEGVYPLPRPNVRSDFWSAGAP